MIRRDFMRLVSIVTAGLAFFRLLPVSTHAALPIASIKRPWLSGSARTGCARLHDPEPLS